jgi:hypothetical protein
MNDEQIAEAVDPIYREKVLRARRAPHSEKMGWGAVIFEEVCGRMRSGIRAQFPNASEDEVKKILRQRLDRLSQLEDRGLFKRVTD